MKKIVEFLKGKKTYILAGLILVIVLAEKMLGIDVPGIDDTNWLEYLLGALGLSTLRAGVNKIGNGTKVLIILAVLSSFFAGCGEPFAEGFGSGVVAMKKIADDSQTKFIESVNNLNAETARLNTEIGAVKEIDITTFLKPETVAAIESLKGREKDPMTWIALASIVGAAFFGGKVHEKKKAETATK